MILTISCRKESTVDRGDDPYAIRSVSVVGKTDTLIHVVFRGSAIISSKITDNDMTEVVTYHYDTTGLITGITIKNLRYDDVIYQDFIYDSLKRTSAINVTMIFRSGDKIEEKRELFYDTIGRLIHVKALLPETMEYVDNNVVKYGKVDIVHARWTDYYYRYDNMINPFYQIGLPSSVLQLSQNNVTAKIAVWTEYVDCMLVNDTTCGPIDHVDTIYTSTFVYKDKKPMVEYRKSRSGIDTLYYYYD